MIEVGFLTARGGSYKYGYLRFKIGTGGIGMYSWDRWW